MQVCLCVGECGWVWESVGLCVPEHGRKRRRRCPGAPWPTLWAVKQKPVGAWGWEALHPAGWINSIESETDPHGTARGSAPTGKSKKEKISR